MERIGKQVVFNVGVLGALLAIKPIVRLESVLKTLEGKFPSAFMGIKKQALELGHEVGLNAGL